MALKITEKLRASSLKSRLHALAESPPDSWRVSGAGARPNLHGILRYPAMMVPSMQGDILDTIIKSTSGSRHVLDPFVGSGTMLTESMLRGVDFTGVDINPLAALVCEAKVAIDKGVDVLSAAEKVLDAIHKDRKRSIGVTFPGREKWFSDDVAVRFAKIRRAICTLSDVGTRKIMWVVFSETIRLCSNSRTSTYKLHKRADGDIVGADRVDATFVQSLRKTCEAVTAYRQALPQQRQGSPNAKIICSDVRHAPIGPATHKHTIMVTSPPYGDNVTTIPYGQFSYLTLRWIPVSDLPNGFDPTLLQSTHSLDTASLGGSRKDAEFKLEAACLVSSHFTKFVHEAEKQKKLNAISKVSSFMYDFFEALTQVHGSHAKSKSSAHWVMTTGNRTAAGIVVPFDAICRDIVEFLGGEVVTSVHRKLPTKRMPSRNSLGDLINTETTLIAEFA
jgi:hypothetical protein